MENPGDKFAIEPNTQDLGPRGRTPLRLILTPPAPQHKVDIAEPPVHEYGAPPILKPKSRSELDLLRRDTIVRSLLGSPKYAFVFITFSEFSSTPMATHDDLRDEERVGGFGDSADDDTFQSAVPAPKIIAAESASVPPPIPAVPDEPVVLKKSGFPYKFIVIGLPLLMLLGAGIVLTQWRHDTTKVQPHEIQMTPEGSTDPTQTAGKLPSPAPEPPAPVAAAPMVSAPVVAAPSPVTVTTPQVVGKKTTKGTSGTSTTVPFDAAAASAASEGIAAPNIAPESATGFYLQVLATPSADEAQRRASGLRKESGLDASVTEIIKNDMTLYRVRLGPFASEATARSAKTNLHLTSAWIVK